MPAGDDVTLPIPLPLTTTVSVRLARNVAVTARSPPSATVHGAVPLQPPPSQPPKIELASGVAVSVTDVPTGYASKQSAPQSMPAGADVTVPPPLPAVTTASVAAGSA